MEVDMKKKPLVACKACNMIQFYRGQKNCLHCGRVLVAIPPWLGK